MSEDDTTVNVDGLDRLLKALKAKQPTTRVGVLGGKVTRNLNENNTETNASIGAKHEYGIGVPQRSFLRVPITEHLQKDLDSASAFDEETFKQVIKSGTVIPWMKKVATVAEAIVAKAFETGGFGKWPAWKTPGYTNNTGQLLIDTHQLRDSITSEVK